MVSLHAGGNQRDLARERAAKKAAGKPKNNESGTAFTKRKESDAEIMRRKNEEAQKKKAEAEANKPPASTGGGSLVKTRL